MVCTNRPSWTGRSPAAVGSDHSLLVPASFPFVPNPTTLEATPGFPPPMPTVEPLPKANGSGHSLP